jgi:hypothetical protein
MTADEMRVSLILSKSSSMTQCALRKNKLPHGKSLTIAESASRRALISRIGG